MSGAVRTVHSQIQTFSVYRALPHSGTTMPARVPSTTKVEDFAQVLNADGTARVTAGRIELAMTKDEELPQGHFQRRIFHAEIGRPQMKAKFLMPAAAVLIRVSAIA